VVTLGKVPTQQLLEESLSITDVAGEIFTKQFDGIERAVLVSVHPAATMYDPSQKPVFDETIEYAAALAGYEDAGQASLTEF
jgi:DNA polymerase